jgi:hypothetical protein
MTEDISFGFEFRSDVVLWVVGGRKVIRRWRLPSEIYGVNYELTFANVCVAALHSTMTSHLATSTALIRMSGEGCYVSILG